MSTDAPWVSPILSVFAIWTVVLPLPDWKTPCKAMAKEAGA